MPRRRRYTETLCMGQVLPDEHALVMCSDSPTGLLDCCVRIDPGESATLCEKVEARRGDYYYWVCIEADEVPLRFCALDMYATHAAKSDDRWRSRRPDYLAIGWHQGECYVLFVELRERLLDAEQLTEDKFLQVEGGMRLLCKQSPDLGMEYHRQQAPLMVADVCDGVIEHKTVGVVIPAAFSRSRADQSPPLGLEIGGKRVPIVALPHYRLHNCQITWSELLEVIGL